MGSSTLQGEIHIYILNLLIQHIDLEKFTIHSNEAGLHIDKGDNLAGDIFLYNRAERNVPTGQFMDWNQDVAIRPGLTFNINQYLEKRGIVVE